MEKYVFLLQTDHCLYLQTNASKHMQNANVLSLFFLQHFIFIIPAKGKRIISFIAFIFYLTDTFKKFFVACYNFHCLFF